MIMGGRREFITSRVSSTHAHPLPISMCRSAVGTTFLVPSSPPHVRAVCAEWGLPKIDVATNLKSYDM